MSNILFSLSKRYRFLSKLVLLIKKIYPQYGLKKSDVILAAYPKSGSTWLRFIINNIISLNEMDGIEIDYNILNGALRVSYDSNDYPEYSFTTLPRFVATHKYYKARVFGSLKKLYLLRNPKDTMVSYYEYRKALKQPEQFKGDFKQFIRNENFGIVAWCKHVNSWLYEADVIISYEELMQNRVDSILKIFTGLDISYNEVSQIQEAIRKSSFKNIRKMEEEKGLDENAKNHLNEGFKFARKGKIGDWVNYFDEEDLEYINSVLTKYNINEKII